MKCASSKGRSDDYNFESYNNCFREVEMPTPVNNHFFEEMNVETYLLTLQSGKHSGHIAGKIGKCINRMNTRMKTAIFRPSDPIPTSLFHKISKLHVTIMKSMTALLCEVSPILLTSQPETP